MWQNKHFRLRRHPLRRIMAPALLGILLTGCWARQADPGPESWADDYMNQAAKTLAPRSRVCAGPVSERFYANNGPDYELDLGAGKVGIIGRGSWGALPPIPSGRSWKAYDANQSVCAFIHRITVHHTHSRYTIQSLQIYHQNQSDPKADIAYHFFIDDDGRIYEARPLGFMGSHSEGDNSHNVGIVLNGDFSKKLPDPRQITALRQLLTALRCPCAPIDGLWTHQQRKGLRYPGAADHYTACPGQHLAVEVYGLARELGFATVTTRP